MKRVTAGKKTAPLKIALALTWDGARRPVASLPPKARAFLAAKGHSTPSRREMARLFAEDAVNALRICWVPCLKGGDDGLADVFTAPCGKRLPFRAARTSHFGDVLGVIYRRAEG
jgi:hypothetical protein